MQVEEYIWIANMVDQHGMSANKSSIPIRYAAVNECLKKVADKARELPASVHMPRIGCGLAGGKWEEIEPLIATNLCSAGVPVIVYDFDK